LTEAIQLFSRANGSVVLCCAVNLHERHLCNPIARPSASGLHLWCKEDRAEHLIPWQQTLSVMERFVSAEEFLRILRHARGEHGRESGRGEE
jgi:hypothetical protein